jgi:uncharacterized delta-60 repeat protein
VARLNSDGSRDTTFNGTGLVDTGVGVSVASLMVDPAGNIIVTGTTYGHGTFAAVRLTSNGGLDTSFNGSGYASYPVGSDSGSSAATIDGNGRIVMVGPALGNTTSFDFVAARLKLRWTPLSRPKNGDPSLLSHQRPVMLAPR